MILSLGKIGSFQRGEPSLSTTLINFYEEAKGIFVSPRILGLQWVRRLEGKGDGVGGRKEHDKYVFEGKHREEK